MVELFDEGRGSFHVCLSVFSALLYVRLRHVYVASGLRRK